MTTPNRTNSSGGPGNPDPNIQAPQRDPNAFRLALAGNPNSGKTTIFNALTGDRQHVGNYPGVTVERKEGLALFRQATIQVIDLPGAYSLTSHSPDEMVARRVLLDERPEVVAQIVDAGNLERNLYLTTQLIAMKTPLVLVLNMMDEAQKRGIRIDLPALSALLGVPIVPAVGYRREGIDELLAAATEVAAAVRRPAVEIHYGPELDLALGRLSDAVAGTALTKKYDPDWLALQLLEADPEVTGWFREAGEDRALRAAEAERARLRTLLGEDPEILLADARYGFVHGALAETVRRPAHDRIALTDRVDTVLANRVLGLPIFLLIMLLTFEVTFRGGAPLARLIGIGAERLGAAAAALLPAGILSSLLVDGVIAGVGGVLQFLPNIMLLFIMVSLMEDSGYMARAAFIVDRAMHLAGLHGKSFIPLFLGFGCNVAAIMGARILESERDRRLVIMTAPFISCSARLPIYVLLAGSFFPPAAAGLVIFSLYLLGIVVAMTAARLLAIFVVTGPTTPFVMELPPYRLPTLRSALLHTWFRAWLYLKKAGTIILAMSILVWFLSHYPAPPAGATPAERTERSLAGIMGKALAPALGPAGLDNWKVTIALLTGVVAKEVVVSTLGTIYAGENGDRANDDQSGPGEDPERPASEASGGSCQCAFVLDRHDRLSIIAGRRKWLRTFVR